MRKSLILFGLFLLSIGSFVDGLNARKRIISGYSATAKQFPWQVILKQSRNGPLHGAGSVISRNWILTAGHCIYGLRSIHLVFGTNFWTSRNALSLYSRELFPHPNFNEATFENDIGLIKLKRPLKYSSTIQPIALVSIEDQNNDFVGTRAIITGFGYIHHEIPNPVGDLLRAEVTIISNEECMESYKEIVTNSTLCTIGADNSNQAICDGDSGGPLIIRDRYGKIIQIGVISFSADLSCDDNHPSAFARVSSYLDYIAQVTNMTIT